MDNVSELGDKLADHLSKLRRKVAELYANSQNDEFDHADALIKVITERWPDLSYLLDQIVELQEYLTGTEALNPGPSAVTTKPTKGRKQVGGDKSEAAGKRRTMKGVKWPEMGAALNANALANSDLFDVVFLGQLRTKQFCFLDGNDHNSLLVQYLADCHRQPGQVNHVIPGIRPASLSTACISLRHKVGNILGNLLGIDLQKPLPNLFEHAGFRTFCTEGLMRPVDQELWVTLGRILSNQRISVLRPTDIPTVMQSSPLFYANHPLSGYPTPGEVTLVKYLASNLGQRDRGTKPTEYFLQTLGFGEDGEQLSETHALLVHLAQRLLTYCNQTTVTHKYPSAELTFLCSIDSPAIADFLSSPDSLCMRNTFWVPFFSIASGVELKDLMQAFNPAHPAPLSFNNTVKIDTASPVYAQSSIEI